MPQTTQRSFTGGELAPALHSRVDLSRYANGLKLCENYIIRAQGGVYSRPGFRFIGELSDSSRKARLIEFSFNTEQTYVLVFEHLKLRVIRDGGFVLSGATEFELVTTYTEGELPDLGYAQTADVLTITHPNHNPANLNRLADDNWALTDVDYSPGLTPPVFSGSTVKSITGITQADPAVVTASSHGFTTGNTITIDSVSGMTEVNDRSFTITVINANSFSLDDEDATSHTAYTSGGNANRANSATTVGSGGGDFTKTYKYVVTAVDVDGVESVASSPASISTNSLSQTFGVRLSWGSVSGADYYRVYKDLSGDTAVYGWVGDSNNTSFDDYNVAPSTSDAPPEDRQPFTGTDNKPAVVGYYQQRQVFASTNNEPQTTFTTQTNSFNSLRTSNPARDDDAVTFTISARQVNKIRHILALDSLILLTSGGEWKVTEGQDQILTPSTIGVRIQSYNGASTVTPVVVNSTALYIQEKGTRVRDLTYEFSNDTYSGNDLSLMAEHLFEGKQVTDMAYASEPYSVVWCVRNDGVLLGLTYQREHQVWGWHRHTTDGEFESVTTITEGNRDAVYVIVKRTVGGVTKRYVERMETRETINVEDAFCVDSGLSYDGSPVTLINGLDHLEGKTVSILADGYVVADQVVSSGEITLTRAASKVHVGLAYTPALETLDVDFVNAAQSLKVQSLSVAKVFLQVEASRGGFVAPINDDGTAGEFQEIVPRTDSDGYGAIPLKTYQQEVIVSANWNKSGSVRVEQRAPLPSAILSVIPDIDIGGI